MTAAEARQKTNDIVNDRNSEQWLAIIEMIKEAACKGEDHVQVYNVPITKEVKEKLEEIGYTVHVPRNEHTDYYTNISW